jgi:hypothetical protein
LDADAGAELNAARREAEAACVARSAIAINEVGIGVTVPADLLEDALLDLFIGDWSV